MRGGVADPECLARVEAKFAAAWARIEARGGCALTGDAAVAESRVEQLVADLVAAIPPTTSTTTTQTTTSSCPPTTAFYCGDFCPPSPPVALCPPDMTCTTTGATHLHRPAASVRQPQWEVLLLRRVSARAEVRHRPRVDRLHPAVYLPVIG